MNPWIFLYLIMACWCTVDYLDKEKVRYRNFNLVLAIINWLSVIMFLTGIIK